VRGNTIYRSGGILLQVALHGNEVSYNDLYDAFLSCYGGNKDVSALYTQAPLCSGTRFHHNWVHDGYAGTPPHPWGGGMGIRGDDNTCGLTVDHNVVWNLGSAGVELKNVSSPTPEQANVLANNTVFNHSNYNEKKTAVVFETEHGSENSLSTVVNNLTDGIYGHWFNKPLGLVNLCTNNTASFDPSTEIVSTNWCDFRPAAGSSAIIGGGYALEGISPLEGTNAPDIGAYQRDGATYWIPGQRLAKASYPIVPDQAKEVPADRDILMWRPAFKAASHLVTFATSKEGLDQSAAPTLQKSFQGEENVFTLPPLHYGQTYFWRVDAVMPDKSVVKGDVWSFETKAEPVIVQPTPQESTNSSSTNAEPVQAESTNSGGGSTN
jgi:hypothetical protein